VISTLRPQDLTVLIAEIKQLTPAKRHDIQGNNLFLIRHYKVYIVACWTLHVLSLRFTGLSTLFVSFLLGRLSIFFFFLAFILGFAGVAGHFSNYLLCFID